MIPAQPARIADASSILAASTFVGACLLLIVVGFSREIAYIALITDSVAVAPGECVFTTALMPLVADLAPARPLHGFNGSSWWVGLDVAPVLDLVVVVQMKA